MLTHDRTASTRYRQQTDVDRGDVTQHNVMVARLAYMAAKRARSDRPLRQWPRISPSRSSFCEYEGEDVVHNLLRMGEIHPMCGFLVDFDFRLLCKFRYEMRSGISGVAYKVCRQYGRTAFAQTTYFGRCRRE